MVLCVAVVADIADKVIAMGGLGNTSWGASREMQQSYLNISQITSVIFLLLSGLLLYALMRRHYTYAGMVALVI